jgi:hypothetical protein
MELFSLTVTLRCIREYSNGLYFWEKRKRNLKVYMRGWLNYYGIADMKNNMESLNGWLYRRIRMCIWKQWKLPRTRKRRTNRFRVAGMGSLRGGIQQKILLENVQHRRGQKSIDKGKTDKLGLL